MIQNLRGLFATIVKHYNSNDNKYEVFYKSKVDFDPEDNPDDIQTSSSNIKVTLKTKIQPIHKFFIF